MGTSLILVLIFDCPIFLSQPYLSRVIRKPDFCLCENKGTDQLCSNCTIPILPKSKISSIWPSSVAVQDGLCRIWSETPKTVFLATRLIFVIKDHVNPETFTYLAEAVSELGHISLEKTACNVSHSMKAKLWVFTIPGTKTDSFYIGVHVKCSGKI